MRIALAITLLIMLAVACEGPMLEVERLEITNTTPPDESYNVKIVNSKDNSGLCKTGPAKGPITIQAWSSPSSDINEYGRRPQGGRMILPEGQELAPGDSIVLDRPFGSKIGADLDPTRDKFLILQVYTGEATVVFPKPAVDETGRRCSRIVATKAVPIE